jgi:hypothetical protein
MTAAMTALVIFVFTGRHEISPLVFVKRSGESVVLYRYLRREKCPQTPPPEAIFRTNSIVLPNPRRKVMQNQATATSSVSGCAPWNKGRLIGAKPPLRPKHVWTMRTKL